MSVLNRTTEFELADGRAGLLTFSGRIFLSAIFLVSAFMLLTDWAGMRQLLALHGLGEPAPYLMAMSLACEILGGLSLLFGFYARVGALLLTAYLVGVTLILNNFWAYPTVEQPVQIVMCLKNLAIMGGLLNIMAYGAGPWSIDAKRYVDPRLISNEQPIEVLTSDSTIIV
jgi:putative oxidoreductase